MNTNQVKIQLYDIAINAVVDAGNKMRVAAKSLDEASAIFDATQKVQWRLHQIKNDIVPEDFDITTYTGNN